MAETTQSRRSALQAIGLFLAGVAGLWRFLTPRMAPAKGAPKRPIAIAAGEIPRDGALVLPQFGVAVVRDGAELLAVDLACTHLGCTVTATTSGFACPCHGSRYNCRGEILAGAASRPLRRVHVEEQNGVVRVAADPGTASATRSSPVGVGIGRI